MHVIKAKDPLRPDKIECHNIFTPQREKWIEFLGVLLLNEDSSSDVILSIWLKMMLDALSSFKDYLQYLLNQRYLGAHPF